ncbi:MAG: response regulator, partial [Lentisphaeraceae bacterium]|nr:response regulator [Lentisphaeraceae bacterium]
AKSLEQSNQYKSDFLASMSHELRTPLNCMLILSKILSENKKGNLSDKQVEYTTTIHQAGNALLSLINDVLNLAKIDAGKIDLSYSRINLSEFSDYIERHFSPLSKDKGLKFKVELEKGLPEFFICDLKALQQICRNLIFNAIKFTEEGSVNIKISQKENRLVIVVRDTGIGIKAEDQNRIFEAFQQLDKGNSRKYEGTGLGLSITKKLVNELKGEIKVESSEDKGSVFTLLLPLETVEKMETADEQAATEAGPEESTGNSYDLLLVEDNSQLVKALVALIEEKGLSIKSCNSSKAAMKMVQGNSFKAIILDLNLEENNSGLKFLEFLKEKNLLQPVIIYTGRKIESDLHIELLKYTDSIVIKDEKMNQRLLEEVQHALSCKEEESKPLADVHGESSLTNKKVLVVDDDARNLFSLSNLLEEYDMTVDLARNGKEALEKISAVKYDIVLMDIMMPEMDGYEAIRIIRDEHSRSIPILALTAKAMKGEREKCIAIGASDYMSKPIDIDNLINQLKVWLS